MTIPTITSANSSYVLTVPDVFSSPIVLKGYNVDTAYDTENVEPVEVQIGVDGFTGAGYTPYLTKQTIEFLANSPSIALFEAWEETQKFAQEAYPASCTIIIPSISKIYKGQVGWLTTYSPMSSAKKVLGGRGFTLTWGSLTPQNA